MGFVQDRARFLLLGSYPFFWCLLDFNLWSAIPIHSEPSYDPTKRLVEAYIFCLLFEFTFWIWASELPIPHLRRNILPIHLTPDTPMAPKEGFFLGKAICSVLKPKFFKRLARLGHKTLQNMLKWFICPTWNVFFSMAGSLSKDCNSCHQNYMFRIGNPELNTFICHCYWMGGVDPSHILRSFIYLIISWNIPNLDQFQSKKATWILAFHPLFWVV